MKQKQALSLASDTDINPIHEEWGEGGATKRYSLPVFSL